MSRETRTPLIRVIVIIAAIFFATGLAGHLAHNLDVSSTLLLMFGFAVFSGGITWLAIWDDRRTRTRLISIAANLAPHGLNIQVCKGGTYAVVSQGALFEEIVSEELDLDELEAWKDGLLHGVLLVEARPEDEAMEAHIARQERHYPENLEGIGISGYIDIPGLEE